jgi:hypothetical protein
VVACQSAGPQGLIRPISPEPRSLQFAARNGGCPPTLRRPAAYPYKRTQCQGEVEQSCRAGNGAPAAAGGAAAVPGQLEAGGLPPGGGMGGPAPVCCCRSRQGGGLPLPAEGTEDASELILAIARPSGSKL